MNNKKQNKSFPNREIDRFGPEEDFLNVNQTLNCEDDARDLSIILTDKILNNFENYISKRDRKFYRGVKNIEKEIPLVIETKEEPHIKIWFDDEKGNQGSFYSWELQDLITEVLCKKFNIKEEE